MWLLSTSTLKLHGFLEPVPDYVILSHTGGAGEVSFDDIDKPHAHDMAGYRKFVAWIDTCCIDKKSSAELSEAINSINKWYWQAEICYAYLPDVAIGPDWEREFESSRWFTRGWVIRPSRRYAVEFYDQTWNLLEDMAYCLLGLLQVNMPMLYGEGHRAFHRLQLEIIQQTNEHSIFAWEPSIETSRQVTAILAPSVADITRRQIA
ncbi:hypothetical protein CC86DRAFT_448373 [Ophiobolus disseminans]|uniref:DUF8212 domain-containing protein n=1 Tax=Ophiobolus disseminans TaxID=1469910 RepID=A0A6A6ZQH4_9PLEO|nr:hypothetical protein CC86DRAFT_448373 [Ophiobolus disseminans]